MKSIDTLWRTFEAEPFVPAPLLRNGHVQTLAANIWRRPDGVTFYRERLETPDGDFVDLDFAQPEGAWLASDAPIVLALHGLEGNAHRGYMCESYRQLGQRGIRAIGLNFRTCSGELNLTAKMYNAGTTEDVAWVVETLRRRFPDSPFGLIGFSLGANVMLKYLGEEGSKLAGYVGAAVAVSPPFDMNLGSAALQTQLGQLYGRHFLKTLHAKAKEKAARGLLPSHLDLNAILATRTLYDFDEVATAPMYGYAGAADYYTRCGAGHFIAEIRVPTLLLRSLDDPIIAAADIPHERIAANSMLRAVLTNHGGHVGFMEGNLRKGYRFWAERQAARFLQSALLC